MNFSKEQTIKDLGLSTMSEEQQEEIIGSFFRALQAKIRLAVIESMSDDERQEFALLEGDAADTYMDEYLGEDMDKFIDELYGESVKEFLDSSQALADGMSGKQ